MRKLIQGILFVVFALSNTVAQAMQGVFWQPQVRDLLVSDQAWATLMMKVRQQGFDTLVLQWTQHDSSFTEGKQRQQLLDKVVAAQQAGFKIIAGLHWDSQFFVLQKQSGEALAAYLRQLAVQDLEQLILLQSQLPLAVDGWYVSAEIDDKNWRSFSQRKRLLSWLSSLRLRLSEHSEQPVYISSFFAGNMSPKAYAEMLADISEADYRVWIQDGAGVQVLSAAERQLYLDRAVSCNGQAALVSGVIYELFQQDGQGRFVAAEQKSASPQFKSLKQQGCEHQQLYFSLRYLPAAKYVLEQQAEVLSVPAESS